MTTVRESGITLKAPDGQTTVISRDSITINGVPGITATIEEVPHGSRTRPSIHNFVFEKGLFIGMEEPD